MQDLIRQLRAFAQGCRGSMWQSRDETIRLMDEAAEALTTAQAEIEALRARVAELEKLEAELTANEQEVTRLQTALARYGDWMAMANAPAELQQTIDTALATATALKIVPARAALSGSQP